MKYTSEQLKARAILTLAELKGQYSRGSEVVMITSQLTMLPLLEVVRRIKELAK